MHRGIRDFILKVHAEKLYIEEEDIGKGIVELLSQHAIKKLVMGADADRYYSEYNPKLHYRTSPNSDVNG
jgi:hypothetical protein